MIRENHSRYPVTALTHAGMTGKNNEDRFAVSAFHLSRRNHTPVLLAVLCDGIGGHKAGEIAADLAVNNISQNVAESDGKFPLETLEKGIQQANLAIFKEASQDISKQGMGSTTACVWMIGNKMFTATVGDSRIYLIREGQIRQISIDHTWIQDALDNGLLTPAQVEGHPNRHVIRRYIGAPQPPEIDYRIQFDKGETNQQMLDNQGKTLNDGDRILLCSDGLTDLVSDNEILDAFANNDDKKAVSNLVDLANARGGHDNITIVTFTVPNGIKPAAIKRSKIPYGCAIVAIILGIAVVAMSAYFLWKGFPWQRNPISATPPIVLTINPMITSAPQPSATPDLTLTLNALTNTSTPMMLPTRDRSDSGNYPAPAENSTLESQPTGYP
jgi:protein phosphatase